MSARSRATPWFRERCPTPGHGRIRIRIIWFATSGQAIVYLIDHICEFCQDDLRAHIRMGWIDPYEERDLLVGPAEALRERLDTSRTQFMGSLWTKLGARV